MGINDLMGGVVPDPDDGGYVRHLRAAALCDQYGSTRGDRD